MCSSSSSVSFSLENRLTFNRGQFRGAGQALRLNELKPETYEYFKKLPGHDTLRLILSKRSILVEGPSDELIVQKAFYEKHAVSPLERGVDVISVRGLAFKRFLEIARLLEIRTDVLTDNDGDVKALEEKYLEYKGVKDIFIRYDADIEYKTLEPQLLKANNLGALNKILNQDFKTAADLIKYMTAANNKTDVALAIFETKEPIAFPGYINDAVE